MAAFIVPGFEVAEQILALLKARATAKKATAADVKVTTALVQKIQDLHNATVTEALAPDGPELAGP